VGVDSRLYVSSEIGIWYRRVTKLRLVRLCQRDAFADLPTWALRHLNHGDSAMVLLYNDLYASLDFGQDGMGISGKFILRDAHVSAR
jgi:hypothetical protein